MRLALYQPDIPQNVGAAMRLAACWDVPLDIIEPAGFPLSEKSLKRVAMDYRDKVILEVHASWDAFCAARAGRGRLILLTTQGAQRYDRILFEPDDILILGRESAGVPDFVHQRADLRVKIPLAGHARSFNMVTAGAVVLGEALRQTGFPD